MQTFMWLIIFFVLVIIWDLALIYFILRHFFNQMKEEHEEYLDKEDE